MNKFVLGLGLALILVAWGWQENPGVGTIPAYGQPPPYTYVCDPYYPYSCYYTVPYEDPYTQYFFYAHPDAIPEVEERRLERRERRLERERREEWEREHGFR